MSINNKITKFYLPNFLLVAFTLGACLSFASEASANNRIRVCDGSRPVTISVKSSKKVVKRLQEASRRGRLSLPVAKNTLEGNLRASCPTRQSAVKSRILNRKIVFNSGTSLDVFFRELLNDLLDINDEAPHAPTYSTPAPTIEFTPEEPQFEDVLYSSFPPSPSSESPTYLPRITRDFLNSARFPELNRNWTYDINKDLVVALAKHVNLYTIGGNSPTNVPGFCYGCLPEGSNQIIKDSRGLSGLAVNIAKSSFGDNYTKSILITSMSSTIEFDREGMLTVTSEGQKTSLPLEKIHESQYDTISAGQPARFFTIVTSNGQERYTWRYVSHPTNRKNLGIIINPQGGFSPAGNYEGAFIDFQTSFGMYKSQEINPTEFYFGSRNDAGLGERRLDVTAVYPYGLRLRALNPMGRSVRVFYSGILSGLVTLDLVYGNPASINPGVAGGYYMP